MQSESNKRAESASQNSERVDSGAEIRKETKSRLEQEFNSGRGKARNFKEKTGSVLKNGGRNHKPQKRSLTFPFQVQDLRKSDLNLKLLRFYNLSPLILSWNSGSINWG